MTREQVSRFYQRHYRPEKMVVAVAGNVDHAHVVRRVRKAFGRHGFLDGTAEPVRRPPGRRGPPRRHRRGRGDAASSSRSTSCSACNGLTRSDPRRFALGVLNAALGGGTSSRLFQEVREKRGLAYSVFSFASQHVDAGLVGVSVGCLPTKLDQVLQRRPRRAGQGRRVRHRPRRS